MTLLQGAYNRFNILQKWIGSNYRNGRIKICCLNQLGDTSILLFIRNFFVPLFQTFYTSNRPAID